MTIVDTPQVPTSEVTVVFCNNGLNPLATITVVLPSGLDPNNYLFALIPSGDPDPAFSSYQEGNIFQIQSTVSDGSDIVGDYYDIFVTDSYGCQTRAVRNVVIPELADFDVNAGADISMCQGQSGVQLQGSGSILYTWSCSPSSGMDYLSSSTAQTPTVSSTIPVGTYTFTLNGQDVPGSSPTCSGTDTMVLTVKTKPSITAVTAASYSMCNGSTNQLNVTATDAGSNPTYSWNPSANLNSGTIYNPVYTPSVSIYTGQSFSVTVTADNGCTASGSSSIVEVFPSPVITTGTIVNATCGSSTGSATVSATSPGTSPTPSFNYLWDAAAGSQTTATATGLAAGTYTVTVTDAQHSCSNTHQVTVGSAADTTPPTAVCQDITLNLDGSGNGTITPSQINDGSTDNCTAAGSLVLSLSKTTFNSSNVGANTVTLTVTDASGNFNTCTATVTVVLPSDCSAAGSRTIYQEQFESTAQYTIVGGGTAYTDNGTVMRVTVNTNSSNYFLSNVIDIRSWTNLIAKVSATGNSGNLETADNIRAQYSYDNSTFYDFSNNNPIGGNNNGTICSSVANGTNLYIKVLVLNSSTGEWREFDNVHLTGDPAMEATASITNVTCNGGTNGAINVTVTKGVSPYSYAWTTSDGSGLNATAEDQTGLTAGTYNLVVTDANSVASNQFTFTVTQPAADPTITTSLAVSDATSCNPAGGNVTFTITSAQSGVSYELKTLAGASLSPAVTGTGTGSNLNLTILQANVPTSTTTYKVVATSASGCSTADLTDQPTLTVYTTPAPTGNASQSFCSSTTPRVNNLSVTGTSIIWYNASSGGSVVAGTTLLVNGTTYYASQTVGGCESPNRLAVTATVYATPTIQTVTHGDICGSGVTTLHATSSAGTINWYAASTGGSAISTGTSFTIPSPISTTTSYWVDATISGCTTTSRSEVQARVYAIPTITLGTNPNICTGTNSASLTYSAVSSGIIYYNLNFDEAAEAAGFVDVAYTSLPSSPISVSVPVGATPAEYNAILKVKNNSTQCVSIDYPVKVIINSVTAGGSISPASSTVCPFTNSTTLTLSGHNGSVVKWQSSTDNWVTPVDIANTTTSLTATNIATTKYRAVVQNGACSVANSVEALITASDIAKPTIAFNASKDEVIIAITSSEVATEVAVDFTAFNDGSGARNINPIASDLCTVQSFSNNKTSSNNASGNYPLGETVLTWTASDPSSNSETKTQKVYAARENQFGVTCPADANLGCNPSSWPEGTPTTTIPSWLQTLIDAGTVTLGINVSSVLNAASGTECTVTRTRTYTVTFTIKLGGITIATVTRTCIQTYTYVIDTTGPTISNCPSNITVNVDSGLCSAVVSWTKPTASDNCGMQSFNVVAGAGATTITEPVSGTHQSTVSVGTSTITYTATDNCGNVTTCLFTITVNDNQKPVISSCPANTTVSTLGDVPAAITTALGLGATDNCGINTISHNDVTSLSCPRTITRTYTVTDINSNTETCQQVITITNAPCIEASLCSGTTATNLISGSPTSGTGQLYSQTVSVCSNTTYEIKLTGVSGTTPFNFDVTLDGEVVNDDAMYNSGSTYGFRFKTGPSASSVALVLRNNDTNSLTVSAISFAHCGPTVSAAITEQPVCAGANAELTATVTGSGTYVYQWEVSTDSGTSWSDLANSATVSGATTTELNFTSWDEANLYRIVVSETSGGLDEPNCRIASSTISISPSDTDAPVYQEAFKNSIDPVHSGGNYTYTICDNGTNTLALLALDATDVVDNCTAFGNIIKTYSITNGINNVTDANGDASAYSFPVGSSTVTYEAEDENGNVGTFTFIVVVNQNPALTDVTTDGTVSADGSGYKPYQGSGHTYTVDGGTATAGSTYTWAVLDKDDNVLTAGSANTYTINTTNPAAVVISWGGSIPLTANNYKVRVRETNSTTSCYTEKILSVVILENTFNATVVDKGNACHTVELPNTIIDWDITKTGGGNTWYFSYKIFIDNVEINYSAQGIDPTDVEVTGSSFGLDYLFNNSSQDESVVRLEIYDVYDQYNTSEINLLDNSDEVTLYEVPTIQF